MQTPLRQIQIRNLEINPPLFLAPMAGLTHSALRQLISGFGGIGLLSTEMLGAKKLPTENARVSPYLIRTASEKPLSYQLLVAGAGELAPAIEALHKLKADAVDLNMGCPAPAVGKIGAGIRLMERPEEVRSIVAEARKRTSLPLTAKIRIGIELDDEKLKAFCTMLEDEGIDLISIHARLKKESFARKPRWESIAKVKEWLTIPVVANGGIFSVAGRGKLPPRIGRRRPDARPREQRYDPGFFRKSPGTYTAAPLLRRQCRCPLCMQVLSTI